MAYVLYNFAASGSHAVPQSTEMVPKLDSSVRSVLSAFSPVKACRVETNYYSRTHVQAPFGIQRPLQVFWQATHNEYHEDRGFIKRGLAFT